MGGAQALRELEEEGGVNARYKRYMENRAVVGALVRAFLLA